jgi:hypothetical protein
LLRWSLSSSIADADEEKNNDITDGASTPRRFQGSLQHDH